VNKPLTPGAVADLRALLSRPMPAATAAPQRAGAAARMAVRLAFGAFDAAQTVALAVATLWLFPATAAQFGAGTAAQLGLVVALLAIGMRFALRHGESKPPRMLGMRAARHGAAAVAGAISATGAACWIALSQAGALPDDLLGWFLAWLGAATVLAAGLRLGGQHLAGVLTDGRRVVVVGAADVAEPLAHSLADAEGDGWRVRGRLDDREDGALDRLVRMIEAPGADLVVLAISGADAAQRIAAVCDRLSDQPVRVCLALDAASLAHLPRALTCVGRFGFVDLVTDPHAGLPGLAKRGMDVALGGAALIALSPLLALAALAIRLESPGPVLFRQWRFGLGSRPILVFKFRTMRTDLCDATGAQRTTAADPRVTRVGRFLRRTSIDELPQLINVLRGDMSLVGPRPHPLHMRIGGAYYFEAVERYRARHMVKPGITGWAQVNGSRGEVDTLEKARTRVALDLWYMGNWSFGLDLRILLRTALGGFATFKAD
jgi:exopolysaccharide biosynthesis polyprenyl glycosylphosphotransferase